MMMLGDLPGVQDMAAQANAEEQAEILPEVIRRLGKDEMNLAEFPITLLTDRAPKGQSVIRYQDQIFDARLKRLLTRKLTVTAPEEYGLPTALDDDILLALIQITKNANGFGSREVSFTRYELAKMLKLPDNGQTYKRLLTGLRRWTSAYLDYENSWWDKKQQAWTTRGFHVLDNFELNDSRSRVDQGELFSSAVTWNKVVFESFEAGYLKDIDYDLYINLANQVSKRLYRYISKRFYLRDDWTLNLRDLAFEHVGLSRGYTDNGKIKEKLQPALEELEAVGVLVPLSREDRYRKEGRSWTIRLVQGKKPAPNRSPLSSPVHQEPATLPDDPSLVAQLVARDVTRSKAVELVKQHPAAAIEAKLEIFDWLTEKKDKRLARSPAGWLVKAIEDDYAAPRGFESRADRERKARDGQQRRRQADEERRRRSEVDARVRAEAEAIDRYWAALTPQQQAELDKAARALADPETLAKETGPLKRMGTTIRRRAYIRGLLHEPGAMAPNRE
jgi:hypothetical protein